MKFLSIIIVLFTINYSAAQTDSFIESTSNQFTNSEITKSTQYFRMLLPLRKNASTTKAIALKSKVSHNNKASRFRDRNQLVGFYAFDFASKQTAKLAMDTLLSCFPNACLKVQRNTDLKGEVLPSVYVINATNIYIIETFCEDYNEQWTALTKKFVKNFANKKSIIIHSDCGELKWTNLAEFK